MTNSPEQCVVLVPVASYVEPDTDLCIRGLINRGYTVRYLRGCSQVDLARSSMASEAVRDGFAETLWIDSDMVFEPDDVEKLRAHALPFTAGIYMRKGKPEFAAKFASPGQVKFGTEGGLLEMEYVGFGFAHVRAKVFETMARELKLPGCLGGYDPTKAITPYFVPMLRPDGKGGQEYLSEDASFCHRARQVGFPVLTDTRLKLGHIGRKTYTWDDLIPRQTFEAIQVEIN